MDVQAVVTAALFLAGLAGALALVLVVTARKFAVEENPLIKEVEGVLPQYNCGGCGFPGCSGFARFIVETKDPDAACPPGGPDTRKRVAGILGMEAKESVPTVAHVFCKGSDSKALNEGEFFGLKECTAADLVTAATKVCPYGCMGYGSCVEACTFGAIRVVDGIAEVIEEKCVACGACVKTCPRGLIAMIPQGERVYCECKSKDRGAQVKKYCQVGCITCQLCVKACPEQAISLQNDLITIDQGKCTRCGACILKCPQHSILGAHFEMPAATQSPTKEVVA